MRKYRIKETPEGFYPQEKHWFCWRFIDHLFGRYTWDAFNKEQSICTDLDHAKRCIERRKEWLANGDKKPIYHEIK